MSDILTRELRALHSAIMFFTRIPLPSLANYDPADMQRSAAYFPLVGWLVGGVAALACLKWQAVAALPLHPAWLAPRFCLPRTRSRAAHPARS